MNQITGALTKKYGPLPGYAWAGIAALAAWFLLPRLKGLGVSSSGSSSTSPATAPGQPGFQPDQPPSNRPGRSGLVPIYASTYQQAQDWVAQGIPVYWTDPQGQVQHYTAGTSTGTPVYRLSTVPAGGTGGASRSRSIGNRRAQLMTPHHPDLKLPVRYTQTLQAVGGPSAHTASVHAIAARAGVHPARLLALNPVYSGVIRIH